MTAAASSKAGTNASQSSSDGPWRRLAFALYERGLVVKPPFVLRRDGACVREGGRPPAWMLAEPRPDGVPANPMGRGWGSRLERCSSLYRFVNFEDQV